MSRKASLYPNMPTTEPKEYWLLMVGAGPLKEEEWLSDEVHRLLSERAVRRSGTEPACSGAGRPVLGVPAFRLLSRVELCVTNSASFAVSWSFNVWPHQLASRIKAPGAKPPLPARPPSHPPPPGRSPARLCQDAGPAPQGQDARSPQPSHLATAVCVPGPRGSGKTSPGTDGRLPRLLGSRRTYCAFGLSPRPPSPSEQSGCLINSFFFKSNHPNAFRLFKLYGFLAFFSSPSSWGCDQYGS